VTGKASNDATKQASPPESEMPARNATFNTTASTGNSTNATGIVGEFSKSAGGAKAWGNPTQQASPLGKRSTEEPACGERYTLIAVTATDSTATLSLELSSVELKAPEVQTQTNNTNTNNNQTITDTNTTDITNQTSMSNLLKLASSSLLVLFSFLLF